MGRQTPFILKLFVSLSLIAVLRVAGPAAPAAAQGPWTGPVQLIPFTPSGQSSTFVGPRLQASGSLSASSQLLGNPGFENGGWSPWQTFGTPTLNSVTKHSGSQSARLGNINDANDQVFQTVAATANASDVTLDFWYRLETDETGAGADLFCYGLWDQSGVTALVQRCLDLGVTGNQAWSRETYSLSANERAAVSGQTVLLAFILQTNAAKPSQVWIDDTAVNVTASTPPPSGQHQVFLPLLIRSQAAPPPPPPPSSDSTGAFWLPYIGGNDILSTYGTSIAVDSAGGIHVGYALYTGLDNGQRPAYYAYCAVNCASLANWSLTRLSNYIQDVRLALDPSGHPRMLLYTSSDPNLGDAYEYQYATCDGGCTNSVNWTITDLVTVSLISGRRSYQNNRYFALDPQGRPAFVFSDNDGTFYAYCSSFCTNSANWYRGLIVSNQWPSKAALTFTPAGDPRLLIDYYDSENIRTRLLYIGCDTLACNNSRGRFLINDVAVSIGDAYFSLRMDSNGQPRIALYTGEVVTP
ncbi:MAG: hypothetical protein JSV81_03195, partial [Anaerolineales bacterium]